MVAVTPPAATPQPDCGSTELRELPDCAFSPAVSTKTRGIGLDRALSQCTSSESFVPFAKSVPLKSKLMWMISRNPASHMRPFLAPAYLSPVESEASPDTVCRPPGVVDRALPPLSIQQGLLDADSQAKASYTLAIDT